jgi:hypothetical protein
VWSRKKNGHPTQRAIDVRVKELKDKHNNLFLLPMKSDIEIYMGLGTIAEQHRNFFEKKGQEDTSPINLLNTTGKNHLKDVTALYLTSLPRRNPDHYKAIAISLYGNEVNLRTNDEDMSISWFEDKKLELVYRGELYAELLQIIHRTALRKVNEDTPIQIYLTFDDTKNEPLLEEEQVLLSEINDWYLNGQAKIEKYTVLDETLYNRGDTIRQFAEKVHQWIEKNTTFFNSLPRKLSEIDPQQGIGKRFKKWLSKNNNWEIKKDLINRIFAEYGYIIYEDHNDNRGTKMITTIEDYNQKENFKDVV